MRETLIIGLIGCTLATFQSSVSQIFIQVDEATIKTLSKLCNRSFYVIETKP